MLCSAGHPQHVLALHGGRRRQRGNVRSSGSGGSGSSGSGSSGSGAGKDAASLEEKLAALADLNQLQTALNTAIVSEDWALAAKIRDVLRLLTSDGTGAPARPADWHGLGVSGWLAERAENLGYTFPTGALQWWGHSACVRRLSSASALLDWQLRSSATLPAHPTRLPPSTFRFRFHPHE